MNRKTSNNNEHETNVHLPAAAVASGDVLPPVETDRGIDSSGVVLLPKRKKPKTMKIEQEIDSSSAKKKLRRVDFDAEEDDDINLDATSAGNIAVGLLDDVRPTSLRLTEKGGYLHTKQSRMKISQANQGKCPWNKGKERTESAKAKISAAVKARNHMLLLQKLEALNMTEEEWYAKKKQIKLMRERVRKAKVAAAKYEQEQLELKQKRLTKEMVDDGHDSQSISNIDVNTASSTTKALSETVSKRKSIQAPDTIRINSDLRTVQASNESTHAEVLDQQPKPQSNDTVPSFSPDIKWTPHVLDTPNLTYDMLCPHGGPGGLICCHSCMVQYSKYMMSTFHDIERQAMEKVGSEVQELLNDTGATKQQLVQTMKVARRKPIPIRHYTTSSRTSSSIVRSTGASSVTVTVDQPKVPINLTESDTAIPTDIDPILNFPDNMVTEEV